MRPEKRKQSPIAEIQTITVDLGSIGRKIAEQTFREGKDARELANFLQGAAYAVAFSIWTTEVSEESDAEVIVGTIFAHGNKRWCELTLDPSYIDFLKANVRGEA